MWRLAIYVSFVIVLLPSTNGHEYRQSLLAQLNIQVNKINDLIGRVHKQRFWLFRNSRSCLIGPDYYDHDPTMWRAMAALDQANTVQKILSPAAGPRKPIMPIKNPPQLYNYNNYNLGQPFKPEQSGRRSTSPARAEFNDDFYESLATVFKEDLKERPDLQEQLGDEFDPLILMNPRAKKKKSSQSHTED